MSNSLWSQRPGTCHLSIIVQARILGWVAISFRVSSWPRDWNWVSCNAGRFFTVQATGEMWPRAKCLPKELQPPHLNAVTWTGWLASSLPCGPQSMPCLDHLLLESLPGAKETAEWGTLVEVGAWWAERGESHIRATAPSLSAGAPLSHLILLTKQIQNYKKFQANNHRVLNPKCEVCLHVGPCTTALISGPWSQFCWGLKPYFFHTAKCFSKK